MWVENPHVKIRSPLQDTARSCQSSRKAETAPGTGVSATEFPLPKEQDLKPAPAKGEMIPIDRYFEIRRVAGHLSCASSPLASPKGHQL